jgi:hypothetical protein
MNSEFRQRDWRFSQSSPLGTFVRHAQRPVKVPFRLRKKRSDSLWRPQFVSRLLSRICNSSLSATGGSLARLRLPGVSSRRLVLGPCLLHCGWDRPDRKHPMPDPQRPDSASPGPGRISSSRHLAEFSPAVRCAGTAELTGRPRQTPGGPLPTLGPALQRYPSMRIPRR